MRKFIFLAVASYLWRKFRTRGVHDRGCVAPLKLEAPLL
jgi:hypothetical protein